MNRTVNNLAASSGLLYVMPDLIRHPARFLDSGVRRNDGVHDKPRGMCPRGFKLKRHPCLIFVVIFLIVLGFSLMMQASVLFAEEKWPGVDKAVVEKMAKEHGREARAPLINTDQGDLLLFLFLIAGVVGGFAAGYYWRILIERRCANRE